MNLEEEVRNMNAKLDTLLYGQATTDTRLKSVEENVKELNRTVRGSNGDHGLVAEVYLMKKQIEEFVKATKQDKVDRDEERESRDRERESKYKEDEHDQFVSWKWLIEKAALPVGISFILWLLLTVLPKLSGLLDL